MINYIDAKEEMIRRYTLVDQLKYFIMTNYLIHKEIDDKMLSVVEQILLDEESDEGYEYLFYLSKTETFLKRYLKVIIKHYDISLLEVLKKVYEYINLQSDNIINKTRKLDIMNNYIQIARYEKGEYTNSGYYTSLDDLVNLPIKEKEMINVKEKEIARYLIENGKKHNEQVHYNSFIAAAHNVSFSDFDKKNIYEQINGINKKYK